MSKPSLDLQPFQFHLCFAASLAVHWCGRIRLLRQLAPGDAAFQAPPPPLHALPSVSPVICPLCSAGVANNTTLHPAQNWAKNQVMTKFHLNDRVRMSLNLCRHQDAQVEKGVANGEDEIVDQIHWQC